MSGTLGASAPSTLDLIAGSFSRWAMAAVVVPAAVAGAYWGISTLISVREEARDLRNVTAAIVRDAERVERDRRTVTDEVYKAIAESVRRGDERRAEMERNMRDRAAWVDGRINSLEQSLGQLTGGVIELRTEQRAMKAGVDRIEGAVSGLAARPTQTTIPVIAAEPAQPARPARAIDNLRQPWGNAR